MKKKGIIPTETVSLADKDFIIFLVHEQNQILQVEQNQYHLS